jgi:hypothetical protein
MPLAELGRVETAGDAEIRREVEGRDDHAVDALDLADGLDVPDRRHGLDQQHHHGGVATFRQVAEQRRAPAGMRDEGPPAPASARRVARQRDRMRRFLRRADEGEADALRAEIERRLHPGLVALRHAHQRCAARALGGADHRVQALGPDRAVFLVDDHVIRPRGGQRLHGDGRGDDVDITAQHLARAQARLHAFRHGRLPVLAGRG